MRPPALPIDKVAAKYSTERAGALRMGCMHNGECAYFQQKHMQELDGLSSLYRDRYCKGDHERCARNKVAEVFGQTAVPEDLRPNDHAVATEMLAPVSS
jgi:hypothetical protein